MAMGNGNGNGNDNGNGNWQWAMEMALSLGKGIDIAYAVQRTGLDTGNKLKSYIHFTNNLDKLIITDKVCLEK